MYVINNNLNMYAIYSMSETQYGAVFRRKQCCNISYTSILYVKRAIQKNS